MTVPVSGNVSFSMLNTEIQRSPTAQLELDDPDLRVMAQKPSGNIAISNLRGTSYEFSVTITSNTNNLVANTLFTSDQLSSPAPKRIIIGQNVVIGSTTSSTPAFRTGTGFSGTLTIVNNGFIDGAGGTANSGIGGDAFQADTSCSLINNSFIRSGGGGGGAGGQGGTGSVTVLVREPTTGGYSNTTYFAQEGWYLTDNQGNPQGSATCGTTYWWNGAALSGSSGAGGPYGTAYMLSGGWYYYRILHGSNGNEYGGCRFYQVYRAQYQNQNTTGGNGGSGGRGKGSNHDKASGSSGSAGGTNAGIGGTGGEGGEFGQNGSAGSSGAAGTVGGGSAGITGGLAGFAIKNIGLVTLTNNGTILGRT